MSIVFGVDFGTSNSSLSINKNGKVEVVDIDSSNKIGKTLKSVIYFNPDEKQLYIGQEAVNEYIENDAYGRYIQSVKSFLPDTSFNSTEMGRRNYKLDELISLILKKIKETGEKYIGHDVDTVVLGRPVVFSEEAEKEKAAEDRLISAARIAGFRNVHMQYEPIAAALSYESTLLEGVEKIVLVGDFGGGTSDFSVIKVRGGGGSKDKDRRDDILSLGGVYIGGDTFDSRIMWKKIAKYFGKDVRVKALMSDFDIGMSTYITGKLKRWHLIPQLKTPKMLQMIKDLRNRADKPELVDNLINLVQDNYGYMLFRSIEKAKIDLSSRDSSVISYDDLKVSIREGIEKDEFDSFIAEDIEKIISCVEKTLSEAGLKPGKIDTVFLTGGSSQISRIKEFFEYKFGKDKVINTDAFTSVGYGLGVYGNLFI